MTATRSEVLREEWGDERYVEALGILSQTYHDCGSIPRDLKSIQALAEASPDAFKLFDIRMSNLNV